MVSRTRKSGPHLLCALIGLCAACGGARSTWDGGIYRSGDVAFRLTAPLPAGWQAITLERASLAYRDDAHDASALVNARCGSKDGDTPLLALTNHLLMGTTEREIAMQETIPFDAREALHTRMSAKLDGVPRSFDIFVLKKDGCVYDFVYVGLPSLADDGARPFEDFVRGFHTLAGSREGT